MSLQNNPYMSPRKHTESNRRLLDIWFMCCPSMILLYPWILLRASNFAVINEYLRDRGAMWVLNLESAVLAICVLLMLATFFVTCSVLIARPLNYWTRVAGIAFAFAIPPLGCPFAYFALRKPRQ